MTRPERFFLWWTAATIAFLLYFVCAAAMAQIIPPYIGLPPGNASVVDQQGGPADAATFYINRNALYSGGTPGFTNSALHVGARVGAQAQAFEWPFLCTLESAGPGENACVYSQAIATAAVPIWAYAADCQDRSPSTHSATIPCVETRVIGGRVVIGHDIVIGGNPDLSLGIRIGPPDDAVNGPAQIDSAIQIRGAYRNAAIVTPPSHYALRSGDFQTGIWLSPNLAFVEVGGARFYFFGGSAPGLSACDGKGNCKSAVFK